MAHEVGTTMSRKNKVIPLELAAKPVLGGRRPSAPSARRYVAVQSERVRLRLWRAAPVALAYLADVVRGVETYDAGKYKAAVQILNRTVPVITSQTVESVTASVSVSSADLAEDLRQRLIATNMISEKTS